VYITSGTKLKKESILFQNLYKQKEGCSIEEILEVLSNFPPVLFCEMNKMMEEGVFDVEELVSISSMQMGKILGPDGLTFEYFICFL
jgi:hypothetical protein